MPSLLVVAVSEPCENPAVGYDYYITREPLNGEQSPIQLSEWLELVHSHPELFSEADAGESRRPTSEWQEHAWMGHPESLGRPGPLFKYSSGAVTFRGDDVTLLFALDLATRLAARVLGENDEEVTRGSVQLADSDLDIIHPFTKKPVFGTFRGTVRGVGTEHHLDVVAQGFLGLGRRKQRYLLCFMVETPAAVSAGRGLVQLTVRGQLSDEGDYGRNRDCSHVLYAFRVVECQIEG